ncbi:MAG: hypothetical protein QOH50_2709 [Kribbellaceae bacterium]|nr:hypothetical protein [Kribbellaceae bacterium]
MPQPQPLPPHSRARILPAGFGDSCYRLEGSRSPQTRRQLSASPSPTRFRRRSELGRHQRIQKSVLASGRRLLEESCQVAGGRWPSTRSRCRQTPGLGGRRTPLRPDLVTHARVAFRRTRSPAARVPASTARGSSGSGAGSAATARFQQPPPSRGMPRPVPGMWRLCRHTSRVLPIAASVPGRGGAGQESNLFDPERNAEGALRRRPTRTTHAVEGAQPPAPGFQARTTPGRNRQRSLHHSLQISPRQLATNLRRVTRDR